ncbi:MAG: ATP-binding protein, partial [Bacteroidota bacterium]
PETYADLNLCRLVINNLLGNALKYSSKKIQAQIEVGFIHQGGRDIYFVKDNGVGFDPESSEKIFEVFERAHLRKEFEGNGIGLAIVKRIIEKHQGIVWAESNLGQGATFFFCLESPDTHKSSS